MSSPGHGPGTGQGAEPAAGRGPGTGRGPGPGASRPRRAVFLDRDGTLLLEKDYLADPAGVELVPGALEALRSLRGAGLALVVVTNQSGIARGLYSEADYHAVAAELDRRLAAAGVPVDGTYHCPHHPDHTAPCDCRKPGPGMYLRAARELDLRLEGSWFVGDKLTDLLPARRFRGGGLLVLTGHGAEAARELPADFEAVPDLPAAARRILAAEAADPR